MQHALDLIFDSFYIVFVDATVFQENALIFKEFFHKVIGIADEKLFAKHVKANAIILFKVFFHSLFLVLLKNGRNVEVLLDFTFEFLSRYKFLHKGLTILAINCER